MQRTAALILALACPIASFAGADAAPRGATTASASAGSVDTPVRQLQVMMGLDGNDWTLLQETPAVMRWRTPEGILVVLSAHEREPDLLPILSDPVRSRDYFRAQAHKHGGGLVEAEVRKTPGITYDLATDKYKLGDLFPQSNDHVTNAYALTATFPLEAVFGEITLIAREGSPTGMREALVATARHFHEPPLDMAMPQHDPYDARFDAGATYMDSDAREWDRVLPQHPLSTIRTLMPRLLAKSRLPGVSESVAAELSAGAAASAATR